MSNIKNTYEKHCLSDSFWFLAKFGSLILLEVGSLIPLGWQGKISGETPAKVISPQAELLTTFRGTSPANAD
jgi:hypothetical protein